MVSMMSARAIELVLTYRTELPVGSDIDPILFISWSDG